MSLDIHYLLPTSTIFVQVFRPMQKNILALKFIYMAMKSRTSEGMARRATIRELLRESNNSGMEDMKIL